MLRITDDERQPLISPALRELIIQSESRRLEIPIQSKSASLELAEIIALLKTAEMKKNIKKFPITTSSFAFGSFLLAIGFSVAFYYTYKSTNNEILSNILKYNETFINGTQCGVLFPINNTYCHANNTNNIGADPIQDLTPINSTLPVILNECLNMTKHLCHTPGYVGLFMIEIILILASAFTCLAFLITTLKAKHTIEPPPRLEDCEASLQHLVTDISRRYELNIHLYSLISEVISKLESKKLQILNRESIGAFMEFANNVSSVHYSFFKGRPMGCMLYFMSALPEDLENYSHKYILIRDNNKSQFQLFYVNSKEILPINIIDKDKFISMLEKLNKNNLHKLYLTHAQIGELITRNGGHRHEVRNVNRLTTDIQKIIKDKYRKLAA